MTTLPRPPVETPIQDASGKIKLPWITWLNHLWHFSPGGGGTGALPIANGGTGQTTKTAAFDALSPLTTKGDLIAFDGTNNNRLAVGSDGQYFVSDSTQANGVKWAPLLSAGALLVYDNVIGTANITITSTDVAAQDTVFSGSSVNYDGSTKIKIEFFIPTSVITGQSHGVWFSLYEDTTMIGYISYIESQSSVQFAGFVKGEAERTPSAGNHTYYIKAYKSVGGTATLAMGSANSRTNGVFRITNANTTVFPAIAISTPASSSAAGVAGQVLADSSYLYICTATNTWKRISLSAF